MTFQNRNVIIVISLAILQRTVEYNNQDDAQVPMTFEEMLSRCEEQTDSPHDPVKIRLETWDVIMRHVTQQIEPNMDHDEEFQRTSRDRKEDEEQGRRCRGTYMSTCQVDTSFRTVWPDVRTQK